MALRAGVTKQRVGSHRCVGSSEEQSSAFAFCDIPRAYFIPKENKSYVFLEEKKPTIDIFESWVILAIRGGN